MGKISIFFLLLVSLATFCFSFEGKYTLSSINYTEFAWDNISKMTTEKDTLATSNFLNFFERKFPERSIHNYYQSFDFFNADSAILFVLANITIDSLPSYDTLLQITFPYLETDSTIVFGNNELVLGKGTNAIYFREGRVIRMVSIAIDVIKVEKSVGHVLDSAMLVDTLNSFYNLDSAMTNIQDSVFTWYRRVIMKHSFKKEPSSQDQYLLEKSNITCITDPCDNYRIINTTLDETTFVAALMDSSGAFIADQNNPYLGKQILVNGYFSTDSLTSWISPGKVFVIEQQAPVTISSKIEPQSGKLVLRVSPNPFRQFTKITFTPGADFLSLNIYDINGKLVNSFNNIKSNVVTWNSHNVPSGVYMAKLTLKKGTITQKMILLK